MIIHLRIHGEVAKVVNFESAELDVRPGSTIEEVFRGLGIEIRKPYLFVVDKNVVNKDFVLHENAGVILFPFVSGG